MSINFAKIRTYPLAERKSKVRVSDFARPTFARHSIQPFLDTLPNLLAGRDFRAVVEACRQAREKSKPLVWSLGGHVIKCGLSPLLIDLMKRGFVQHLAMNGAGLIHDFEIALIGSTSEDVDASLRTGAFGMARETGEQINAAVNEFVPQGYGLGAAVGMRLEKNWGGKMPAPKFLQHSLLAVAYRLNIPTTIHLAIGTDIIHNHPAVNGRWLGEGALRDYRTLVSSVAELNGGGVFLNFGSAVLMPEVFLKAVSLIRNQGQPLKNFTTVNFDFIQHYRGVQNIVKRPTQNGAGHGYSITGHHELMLPLLAAALTSGKNRKGNPRPRPGRTQ